MSISCQQLKTEYEHLKKLKDEFVVAYEQVKEGDILTEIKKLKHNLDKAKRALDEKLFVSIQKAREILGQENVLGPEEVAKTWGVKLEDVPEIPFSIQELKNAEILGQMLVLRIDKTAQGNPLSIEAMDNIIQLKWDAKMKGDLLHAKYEWSSTIIDFNQKTPRPGWAMVGKDLLPDSTNNTYLEQTEVIIKTLRQKVFKDMKLPAIYQEAIAEFEAQKENLAQLISMEQWTELANELSKLKISQLARQSAQEAVYDLAIYYDNHNIHLLPKQVIWLNSYSVQDQIVLLGQFDLNGLWIGGEYHLINRNDDVGVCLSRRS